jgi:hypothetical protein
LGFRRGLKPLVTSYQLQLTMPDLKRVKILSWTDGDAGRRFGWTTVTVAEALKSSEKHFRCAACDGPVKLVRKKSEESGGHPEHLELGVRCGTSLLPRKASNKKRTQSLYRTGDEVQVVRALQHPRSPAVLLFPGMHR